MKPTKIILRERPAEPRIEPLFLPATLVTVRPAIVNAPG